MADIAFEISDRLKAIANQVKYRSIVDVGTDHAYIPIYLYKNNKIDFAIASDINRGPLEKAALNIKKYMLDKKISLVLGNGFQSIDFIHNQIDTAILAGMGGSLVIDILSKSPDITKSFKQLVLQPQLDLYNVRKYIHSIGFSIEDEEMILEDRKYYNIINAVKGNEIYDREEYYKYGKILIEKKSSILKQNLIITVKKYDIIVNSLNCKHTERTVQRVKNLKDEIQTVKEVLKWL